MLGLVFHYQDFLASFQEGRYTYMAAINMEMWRQTAKAFGATHMIAVTQDPIRYDHTDTEIVYELYPTAPEAATAHPGATLVYMEGEAYIPADTPYEYVEKFTHPAGDALYVVGPDYQAFPVSGMDLTGDNRLVVVRTSQNFSLWSILAAAIVLRDRWMKASG